MQQHRFLPIGDVLPYLRRFGWASHSFAAQSRGVVAVGDHHHAVAYFDTGDAWVTAGPPLCAPEQLTSVAAGFVRHATEAGRRAVFFGVDLPVAHATGLRSFCIGEDPCYSTAEWQTTIRRPSMREQLRRARAKGVGVYAAVSQDGMPPRADELTALADQWLARRKMAAMHFLLEVDLWRAPGERLWCLAERDGRLVGAAVASPIYARGDMLLEHLLRSDDAPNGTSELLIDHLMQSCADRGIERVSLGLVPLRGDVPVWLTTAGTLARGFYDFQGLAAFKSRMQPCAWHPLYIAHNAIAAPLAMYDACVAFGGGKLGSFVRATISHQVQTRWRSPEMARLA